MTRTDDLSDIEDTPNVSEIPTETIIPSKYIHGNFKPSGRILNCMTQLPNQVYKSKEGVWEVKPLRGNSALYASNQFLQESSEWETHLIAWTGELFADNETIPHSIPTNALIENDPLYLDDSDKVAVTEKIRKSNNSENIHPVWLLRKDQDRWRKYAENVLWPVLHYMQNQPSDGREETQWWHDYVKFNEAYAAKIIAIYKPGDVIWIHDYYLLLLPQILRMELPDASIGHFLHAPFPSSEYFRCLSKRKILLDGMLGANQLGFQSYSFARHFISCCARLLQYEVTPTSVHVHSSYVKVVTFPLGIDVSKLEHDAFTENVERKVNALRKLNGNRKIIIGRDRLDLVRGVVQKLQAFETFLDMYPEWIGKVVLIQVSFKPFYHSSKLDKKVNELVSQINGKYGTLEYTPVQNYNMRIAKDEYLALLRVADLCLITSIRDGMNTTALEYIVCQKESKSPLILSEFSGTTTVLQDSIQVNPWDSVGVSNTINECLLMADETKTDIEASLYKSVCSNTTKDWTFHYLDNLLSFVSKLNSKHGTPYLNKPLLLNNYQVAKHRLFLFDYDGTLTPIVRDPSAAIPSARLSDTLKQLTKDPRNEIWIISGRDQEFLEKWIGANYPEIGLSAEHGCFMKKVGDKNWINLAESFDMSWQAIVEDVFQRYNGKTPGTFTEKKKVALTWHYRKADPELGLFQAAKCKQELIERLKGYDVEVMSGKANLEVRPSFVNKGEIVKRLVLCSDPVTKQLRSIDNVPDFMLCLGDDTTDEDMFKALNNIESDWKDDNISTNSFGSYGVYPVTVGPANKETVAKAYLSDPGQVLDTLGLLVGQVSLFETGGTVELDDRGHLKNSESSHRSQLARKAYQMKLSHTATDSDQIANPEVSQE
ncbi:glycosyltransferase family 20 protein [[Candida] arabinofermentans NRRL YB-2248]|uniref:Glycosyltransferase family 20 protein n=1 Tax=[Candida] arabinofermentans NRRL YB-2248 TaxID=983967 RepID=A0A1E4T3M5_9ASCO|nr:glycosyltransferase family 20 protein [[Candida] arabinofermentans NRRL YB-2248]